jgi:hypothetical protein
MARPARPVERGDTSRGQTRRGTAFLVKQVESGDAGDFSRMSDDELREFIAGQRQDFGLVLMQGQGKALRSGSCFAHYDHGRSRGKRRPAAICYCGVRFRLLLTPTRTCAAPEFAMQTERYENSGRGLLAKASLATVSPTGRPPVLK